MGTTASESFPPRDSKKAGYPELAVVDTPGVFDNVQTEEEMKTEVRTAISFAAPCGQIHRDSHHGLVHMWR